jgi:hypothetical protein
VTVNDALEYTVAPLLLTDIFPVVAPLGTVVVIEVLEEELVVANTPLKATIGELKFVPEIVTVEPTAPLVGVKLVIVGGSGVTVKSVADVSVVVPLTTVILPVVAPLGTTVVMLVAVDAVTVVEVPLNETLGEAKLVPVMVTVVPIGPLVGENPVRVGVGGGFGPLSTVTCTSSDADPSLLSVTVSVNTYVPWTRLVALVLDAVGVVREY